VDGRSDFIRRWKGLRLALGVFAACLLLAAALKPVLLFPIWLVGLPVFGILLWRVRCWQCSGRLVANAGSEIRWRRDGLWDWKPCEHKRCGAPLLGAPVRLVHRRCTRASPIVNRSALISPETSLTFP